MRVSILLILPIDKVKVGILGDVATPEPQFLLIKYSLLELELQNFVGVEDTDGIFVWHSANR